MHTHSHAISLNGRAGGFKPLSMTSPFLSVLPFMEKEESPLKRKTLEAPIEKGTFVKAIKQSFVKNPRMMPMTRLMLTLISGWAGDGGKIETTIGIIAKHLSRSRRQVIRYLKDAVEEGYLFYSRTKNRQGLYTGIRIRLNFAAIRYVHRQKPKTDSAQTPAKPVCRRS